MAKIKYHGRTYPTRRVCFETSGGYLDGIVSTEALAEALAPGGEFTDAEAQTIADGIIYYVPKYILARASDAALRRFVYEGLF